MKAFILWLHHRRKINFLLLVTYFLLVVLPHEQVGLLTVDLFGHLPRDTYNLIIIATGTLGLTAFLIPCWNRIKQHPQRNRITLFLLVTIGLIILTINTLFVINIEVIHFVQYAMMALLLFPLTLRLGETLFWATLLGAIDEAYQYFYLAPQRTDYYDFNDVITNLLGAALMLIFLKTYHFENKSIQVRTSWYRSAPVITTAIITLLMLVLYVTGIVGIYPPDSGETTFNYLLVRVVPQNFWSVVHPNVTYHVIQPLEGTILTASLLMGYNWGFSQNELSTS
ncbi:MAG: hypothetical protein AAGK47_01415 [Bacteroidota bacterium]